MRRDGNRVWSNGSVVEELVSLDRIEAGDLSSEERESLIQELKMYRDRFKGHKVVEDRGVGPEKSGRDIYAPYQAVVSFHRTSSSGTVLFESNFEHHHFVRLEISCARLTEHCDRRLVSDDSQIIVVSMSDSQFAELITTMNSGTGVPATIDRLMGYTIDRPEYRNNDSEEHKKLIRKMAEDAIDRIESISAMVKNWVVEKKRPTIKELQELLNVVDVALANTPSNFAFVEDELHRRMEKRIAEAKAEIAGHVEACVSRIGLSSIESLKKITDGSSSDS